MRGLGKVFKGAVFIAGLLGLSAAAFAQKDPQTSVSLANVTVEGKTLTQVTLARDDLPTYAAYDISITNNTTNALNRLYFTLTVTDNNNSATDNATFNRVYAGGDPSGADFACSGFGTSTLSCTSGISLNPDTGYMTQKVVVVVNAPRSGSQLTVAGSAGGYEGNSTSGQGCCSSPFIPVNTALIDAVTDATFSYTLNAITFVKGEEQSIIFTGNKGRTSRSDPFATNVSVAPFFIPTGEKYDIGSVYETLLPGNSGNCKDGRRFSNCYKTSISIPLVDYSSVTPTDVLDVCTPPTGTSSLLTIVLRIDGSLIKGSASNAYTDLQLRYDGNPVPPCSTTGTIFPCECRDLRYQYTSSGQGGLLPYSNALRNTIEAVIKNTKNGFVEFF